LGYIVGDQRESQPGSGDDGITKSPQGFFQMPAFFEFSKTTIFNRPAITPEGIALPCGAEIPYLNLSATPVCSWHNMKLVVKFRALPNEKRRQ